MLPYLCMILRSFPFDVSTISGFIVGNVVQIIACAKFAVTFCAFNAFYIGVSWYICVCIGDIKTIFDEIESHLASSDDEFDYLESNMTRFALKRSLLEAVELHNRIFR